MYYLYRHPNGDYVFIEADNEGVILLSSGRRKTIPEALDISATGRTPVGHYNLHTTELFTSGVVTLIYSGITIPTEEFYPELFI